VVYFSTVEPDQAGLKPALLKYISSCSYLLHKNIQWQFWGEKLL